MPAVNGSGSRSQNLNALTEGSLLAGITVLLGLMAIYVPPLQIIIRFLYPLPIIVLTVRHGLRTSAMALIVAGVLTVLVTGLLSGLVLVFGFGVAGLVLGYAFFREYSAVQAFLLATSALLVSQILIIFLASFVMGINPLAASLDILDQSMENAIDMYSRLGLIETEELATMAEALQRSVELIKMVFPVLLLIGSTFTAYLNYVVAVRILERLDQSVPRLPPFREWRLPGVLVWSVLGVSAAASLGHHFQIDLLLVAGYNFAVLAGFLFFVQGLAALFFWTRQLSVPRWLLVLFLFLVLLSPYFLIGLILFGFMDTWWNSRQLDDAGSQFPAFSRWAFPRPLFWAFLVGGLMFTGSRFGQGQFLYTVGLLLMFFAGIPFWLQGLSVGAFFIERFTKRRLFKVLAVLLVFFSPLFLQIILLVGLLDLWFDYRGLFAEN